MGVISRKVFEQQFHKFQIGSAINKYGRDRGMSWASHGMLRVDARVMKRLFGQPVRKICEVSYSLALNSLIYSAAFQLAI